MNVEKLGIIKDLVRVIPDVPYTREDAKRIARLIVRAYDQFIKEKAPSHLRNWQPDSIYTAFRGLCDCKLRLSAIHLS